MRVYYCFPEGKYKALTMSYDDGVLADRRLVSIFNEHGIKATFNLNYSRIVNPTPSAKRAKIAPEEVSTLYKGHEVATHTAHHPSIARCPLTYVADEILEDRKGLEALTGYVVRGHAYPNGSYNKAIEELFHSLGIAYGRPTLCDDSLKLPVNPMDWRPTCHHNNPRLMEYAKTLVNFEKSQYVRLMYVWGHSYEFDENDNWHVIEEFCKYIGNRPDIWYATNIEIIDYMQVIDRLQYNSNCTGVYNPSAQSAWLNVQIEDKDVIVEAKGGVYTKFC